MKDKPGLLSAMEALKRLREGNRHFVSRVQSPYSAPGAPIPAELPVEQNPIAIILGCSDARVPAEIIFHQGLGELFVIRVAGNIVAPSQIGSVEFAASQFGTRLVVVLGHSRCGAVEATIRELQDSSSGGSSNLSSIVNRIRPSVEALLATEIRNDPEALLSEAVLANVRSSANHLRNGSEIMERLIRNEGLLVVGAEYSLATGVVRFFDGIPDSN